jgi:hypothetical protein
LEESFARFERAAAKGHEESIWIMSVVKDVEMERKTWIEAFANTEEPLGWCFAGRLSDPSSRERFDFHKKSAEGGCSWGQLQYGWYFKNGCDFVEKDKKVYVEWSEKAANQNNPWAMDFLGDWFQYGGEGNDKEKAVLFYRAAAELGWKKSMKSLAVMLKNGIGCEKDLRQAVIWDAKEHFDSFRDSFRDILQTAQVAFQFKDETIEKLDCDFDQLCYSLGWGMYWYRYDSWRRAEEKAFGKAFGNRCLDYYCSCVELQQKSIWTFLLCWKETVGVYDVGMAIAEMVWEGREDNLVKSFEESDGEEPETKRIKM